MVSLAQRLISLSHSSSAASRYGANYINRRGDAQTSNLYTSTFFFNKYFINLAFSFSMK